MSDAAIPIAERARLMREIGSRIDYFKRNALARRLRLMGSLGINHVLDVGANSGQYVRTLRRAGYRGQIVSFEPLRDAFTKLERSAKRDKMWRAVQLALGACDQEGTLFVSGDSRASSLKRMLWTHEQIAPYFTTVSKERVTVRRLDSVWDEYVPSGSQVLLKIDAQGSEEDVLDGAGRNLEQVRMVQLEISIEPLYRGSFLLPEVLRYMTGSGFGLVSLEYGFCNPETGQMLQMDGIFARRWAKSDAKAWGTHGAR